MKFVTRREASELCNCSYDTIRRREKDGKLPNTYRNQDGIVMIAVADLVAAGFLDPLADGQVDDLVGRGRLERDLGTARHDLEKAHQRIDELTERLAAKDDEIVFLRGLVSAGRAA